MKELTSQDIITLVRNRADEQIVVQVGGELYCCNPQDEELVDAVAATKEKEAAEAEAARVARAEDADTGDDTDGGGPTDPDVGQQGGAQTTTDNSGQQQ